MHSRIQDFISVLRLNGIRVSISEHLDALAAVSEMGIRDRAVFQDTLRTTLIKSARDIPGFDDLFQIYFTGLTDLLSQNHDRLLVDMFNYNHDFNEFIDQLKDFLEAHHIELTPLMQMILFQDLSAMQQLITAANQQIGLARIQNLLQEGYFTRSMLTELDWYTAMSGLERLRELLHSKDVSGQGEPLPMQIEEYIGRLIQDFPRAVREYVRMEREKNSYKALEKFRNESLFERNFNFLTRDEVEKMQEMVKRLAERLKQVISLRRKRVKHGTLDVKSTIRKNMQYGGVPFRIQLRRRKKQKPELVLLCDVSDSVRTASRFMLLFTYSVQELFQRVRSFIFVSQIGEVTQIFKDLPVNQAIEQAYCGSTINLYSHSNFGHAFSMFYQNHLHTINPHTTVIIIGDARNNYNPAEEWALREIKARAKMVIWMNPEPRTSWGFGDSEMKTYARFCDLTEEVRNLKQLTQMVDRLVGM